MSNQLSKLISRLDLASDQLHALKQCKNDLDIHYSNDGLNEPDELDCQKLRRYHYYKKEISNKQRKIKNLKINISKIEKAFQ